MTGDRKCCTHLQKGQERSSLTDNYRLVKDYLFSERSIECALSEAVSAHMKENKVLRYSSKDLLRTCHAQ